MKKMIAVAVISALVSVFAFAGCQKSNTSAPKSPEQSSGTASTPAKPAVGC